MKKIILSAGIVIAVNNIICYSQNYLNNAPAYYIDGIRNTEAFYGSTARSAGMAGAFGALGGDLGGVSVNPAAIGVYRSSEFSFTPDLSSLNTTSTYLGNKTDNNDYKFNFDNIGLLLNLNSKSSNGWLNMNFAFGYNKLNNFTNSFIIDGTAVKGSSLSSLANEFLNNSNGTRPENLDPYSERLAFDTYIIDTVRGSKASGNYSYYSPFNNILLHQNQLYDISGTSGEYFFGIGANYNNKFYWGITMNIVSGFYNEDFTHTETNVDNDTVSFDYFQYFKNIRTNSTGLNFKIGAIYKPLDVLRLGFAFQTPTMSRIHQEFNSWMMSVKKNGDFYVSYPTDIEGNYIPSAVDNFSFTSPLKAVGSIALTNKLGLLSLDYEYINYNAMNFSNGDNPTDIQASNEANKKGLKATSNLRFGGELRLGSLYLRAGYGIYGSPYAGSEINKDANTNIISGGIGYRLNNLYIDFAYTKLNRTEKYYMYQDVNLQQATLKTSDDSFMATVGLRF